MTQPALIPAPRNEYPDEFEATWAEYPKRPGNPKRAAFKCWQQRIRQDHDPGAILAGVRAYAEYVRASNSEGTPFVMMARTFFGPDLHFLEDWTPPETRPEWATLPQDDEKLWDHAKAHGLPGPGTMTYSQYRRRLQDEIERRLRDGANE